MLPFSRSASVAVVGPHAVSHRDLISDYPSDQLCYGGPIRQGDCWPSIGEAFQQFHGGKVQVEPGVDMDSRDTGHIKAALAAAQSAEVVVLCLGIGNGQEHEGKDRTDTKLPGVQEQFAQQVLALGKPTVLVLVNGGIVSIDKFVGTGAGKPHAIVEAFYPSTRGAEALWMLLTGQANSWGRMPVTLYAENFVE